MAKSKHARSKPHTPKIIIGDGTPSNAEEERMALLIILHLAERNIAEGKVVPIDVAMKRIRGCLQQRRTK